DVCSSDLALMIPGALALRDSYQDLTLPVVIIAGEGDRVVFKERSEQLAANIPGSTLEIVQGAGHMVHHVAPGRILAAVESMADRSDGPMRKVDVSPQAVLTVDALVS